MTFSKLNMLQWLHMQYGVGFLSEVTCPLNKHDRGNTDLKVSYRRTPPWFWWDSQPLDYTAYTVRIRNTMEAPWVTCTWLCPCSHTDQAFMFIRAHSLFRIDC